MAGQRTKAAPLPLRGVATVGASSSRRDRWPRPALAASGGLGNQAMSRPRGSRPIPGGVPVGAPEHADEAMADRRADAALGATSMPALGSSVDARGGARMALPGQPPSRAVQALGPGMTLPDTVRTGLQRGFGEDLSGVRIHTGPQAARLADAVGARAFALGSHIAFGRDQFKPDTPDGRFLVAHELAHALAPGPVRVRRKLTGSPQLEAPPGSGLRKAVLDGYALALGSLQRDDFVNGFVDRVGKYVDDWYPPDQAKQLRDKAAVVVSRSIGIDDKDPDKGPKDAYSLLRKLQAVDRHAGHDDLSELDEGSLGLSLAIASLSDDAAIEIWRAVDDSLATEQSDVSFALGEIDNSAHHVVARYELEIEANLLALLEARQAYGEAQTHGATTGGDRIAMLSRRLLLLDQALRDVRAIPPADSGKLEEALDAAAGSIAAMRAQAQSEPGTLAALHNDPSLLSPQTTQDSRMVSSASIRYFDLLSKSRVVEPDDAFAQTLDTTTAGMMATMASAMSQREREARQMREGVVPTSPTWTLTEFAQMYHRWAAFFSPEEEKQHPLFGLIMGFFSREEGLKSARPDLHGDDFKSAMKHTRSPYELLGITVSIRPFDTASFAVGRFMSLMLLAPMLEHAMGSATDQFRNEVGALGTVRDPLEVYGGATGAYVQAGLKSRGPDGRNNSDPQAAAQAWMDTRAQAFSDAADLPAGMNRLALERIYGSADVAATRPRDRDAPIVGLHKTSAQEGWSYLISTQDPNTPDGGVIAREQRVVPPEVVSYLTAAYASRAMSHGALEPTAKGPDGAPVRIGDKRTRSDGLQASKATASQDLLGTDALPFRASFERDRKTVIDAMANQPGDPVQQLLHDLERYLDAYFLQRPQMEWRIAAVLFIAAAEHNLGDDVSEAISPQHLGQVAIFTAGVGFVTRFLSTRGPLGGILSKGFHAFLQVNGTGEIASIVGVGSYLMEVRKTDSLAAARAWAYITPTIFADLSNLVDAVVSRGVGAATEQVMDRLAEPSSTTPRAMADAAQVFAAEPVARQRMVEACDAELQRLGKENQQGSADYRAMEAFRHELVAAGENAPKTALSPEATKALDEPAPGIHEDDATTRDLADLRPRPAAEMKALRDAVPADLQFRVRVVEDPSLTIGQAPGEATGVHVVAGPTEVQIRVGRDVDAAGVAQHIQTARDMARFTGTAGRLRVLISSVGQRLRIVQSVPGQRRHEAQMEIDKLSRMVEELRVRQQRLDELTFEVEQGQLTTDPQRQKLDLEIASLERQMLEHSQDLGSTAPARGFVAAENRADSLRNTVQRALEARGMKTAQAKAQAQEFVREARKQGRFEALEDLANSGVLPRLVHAGAPMETILAHAGDIHGYGELVNADVDPATADKLFKNPEVGRTLEQHRALDAANAASAAAADVASEWPVDPKTGNYDAEKLPEGWTAEKIRRIASQSTPPPDGVPRLVFRRWRYVQSRKNPLPLNEWAPLGYQANKNRDVSSPHERMALNARGAFPNNMPESVGGRIEYDYEEWTQGGDFEQSRRERTTRRRGETLRYENTRPDGVRPHPHDRGFDVVEHKHMTGTERVLNDSIQFRAQREMAYYTGQKGVHEIVMTSDFPYVADTPPVAPSKPLGVASKVFYADIRTGQVTHVWENGAWREWKGLP